MKLCLLGVIGCLSDGVFGGVPGRGSDGGGLMVWEEEVLVKKR